MAHAEFIDYAQPMINAEKALKATHTALLERDFEAAMIYVLDAIVETKMAYNAILHEKEKYEA